MSFLRKFQIFAGRRELISAIESTIQLLESSEDSDWTSLGVKEILNVLEHELVKIKENQQFNKLELATLYAPTGSIQETAMWNDWSKEYLKIAKVIDKFTA